MQSPPARPLHRAPAPCSGVRQAIARNQWLPPEGRRGPAASKRRRARPACGQAGALLPRSVPGGSGSIRSFGAASMTSRAPRAVPRGRDRPVPACWPKAARCCASGLDERHHRAGWPVGATRPRSPSSRPSWSARPPGPATARASVGRGCRATRGATHQAGRGAVAHEPGRKHAAVCRPYHLSLANGAALHRGPEALRPGAAAGYPRR